MPGERRADLAWEKFLGGRDPLWRRFSTTSLPMIAAPPGSSCNSGDSC
jgi:hypothetical protein